MKFKKHIGDQFLIEVNNQDVWVDEECFERCNPLAGYSEIGMQLKKIFKDIYSVDVSHGDVIQAYYKWLFRKK